ncbi:hypothetical protein Tco_0265878 [Tanacetum coccineum]
MVGSYLLSSEFSDSEYDFAWILSLRRQNHVEDYCSLYQDLRVFTNLKSIEVGRGRMEINCIGGKGVLQVERMSRVMGGMIIGDGIGDFSV